MKAIEEKKDRNIKQVSIVQCARGRAAEMMGIKAQMREKKRIRTIEHSNRGLVKIAGKEERRRERHLLPSEVKKAKKKNDYGSFIEEEDRRQKMGTMENVPPPMWG